MNRRRIRLALAVVIVMEIMTSGSLLYLQSQDSATQIPVEDVVAHYRSRSGGTAPGTPAAERLPTEIPVAAPPDRAEATPAVPANATGTDDTTATTAAQTPKPAAYPAPGVYVYNTDGGEHLESFGGARHDYPNQTTITLSPDGCGQRLRWDALEERWDEMLTCPIDAGDGLQTMTMYHDFFGQAERRDYQCEPGSLNHPAAYKIGATWTVRCTASEAASVGTGTVVEFAALEVDGEEVETVHLRMVTDESGSTRGQSLWDYWLRITDGLTIRQVVSVEADNDTPFGTVHYVEEYEIRLASLTPRA